MHHKVDIEKRFDGVIRLYGKESFERFCQAHICVIGMGGVGSWAVEAFARHGIGYLTLIDPDKVVESNMNRQIQAIQSNLGIPKIMALANRIREINPECKVKTIQKFILPTDDLKELLFQNRFDYVVDAIDTVGTKAGIIAYCRGKKIPLVTIGGAGGQIDPTKIEIADLSKTEQEPLLAKVRKKLRAQHGFLRGTRNKFGIDAIYSKEPLRYAKSLSKDDSAHEEDDLSMGFGTSVTVTASFGMVAAALVLRRLAKI